MINTNPYIFFKGQAKEAMEFYQSIFGGKLETVPFSENVPAPEGLESGVMHAMLTGDVTLMASDSPAASPVAKKITICLSGDDEPKLRGYFEKLSQDIEVQYPLKKESWGDIFGALTDKYGVEWMVSISPKS